MSNIKKSAEKNNKVVTVRLNESKYNDLKKFAKANHLSLSECFRYLLDNRELNSGKINISPKSRKSLINAVVHYWNRSGEIRKTINRLGININQISHKMNITGSNDFKSISELNKTRNEINKHKKLIDKIDKEMTELWRQLE